MKLSNEIAAQVKLLCDDDLYAEIANSSDPIDVKARIMLAKYENIANDAALLRADRELSATISAEREKDPCVKISHLAISGNDLLSIGTPPRSIGGIMNKLLELVIKDPSLNERDSLLSIVNEIKK